MTSCDTVNDLVEKSCTLKSLQVCWQTHKTHINELYILHIVSLVPRASVNFLDRLHHIFLNPHVNKTL